MRASLPLPPMLAGAVALAACGSGTGPGGIATVSITLPAGLLIGDTVTAEVVLRDAGGNILEGRPATFTSSASTTASVNAAGLVTALSAGPASITAAAGGQEATVTIVVRDDTRFGYAWANDAASATYPPNAAYAFNSSGGGITITRSAAGTYAVRFAGLGRATGQRENVQVTSYIEPAFCGTAGWQNDGTDLVVNVRCFAAGGAALDSRYTVLVVGARALPGRLGFAHADQPNNPSYRPASVHNSAAGAVTITRDNVGSYTATFSSLNRGTGSGPELVMVTQVGTASHRCVVLSWDFDGFTANIACTDQAGTATDAQFSLLVMERGRAAQRTGFAWTNQSTVANYTPDPLYSHNRSGGAITAFRSGPGTYQIDFDNFVKGTGTETVVITAYGASNRFCRTGPWGMNTATTFRVNVACYDPSGAPADSRYDIIVIQ
ncbi:MAG: Ig-like domain-containing protein [Gemmatimonadales bacterium]